MTLAPVPGSSWAMLVEMLRGLPDTLLCGPYVSCESCGAGVVLVDHPESGLAFREITGMQGEGMEIHVQFERHRCVRR